MEEEELSRPPHFAERVLSEEETKVFTAVELARLLQFLTNENAKKRQALRIWRGAALLLGVLLVGVMFVLWPSPHDAAGRGWVFLLRPGDEHVRDRRNASVLLRACEGRGDAATIKWLIEQGGGEAMCAPDKGGDVPLRTLLELHPHVAAANMEAFVSSKAVRHPLCSCFAQGKECVRIFIAACSKGMHFGREELDVVWRLCDGRAAAAAVALRELLKREDATTTIMTAAHTQEFLASKLLPLALEDTIEAATGENDGREGPVVQLAKMLRTPQPPLVLAAALLNATSKQLQALGIEDCCDCGNQPTPKCTRESSCLQQGLSDVQLVRQLVKDRKCSLQGLVDERWAAEVAVEALCAAAFYARDKSDYLQKRASALLEALQTVESPADWERAVAFPGQASCFGRESSVSVTLGAVCAWVRMLAATGVFRRLQFVPSRPAWQQNDAERAAVSGDIWHISKDVRSVLISFNASCTLLASPARICICNDEEATTCTALRIGPPSNTFEELELNGPAFVTKCGDADVRIVGVSAY